jgi:hypothetical protein
MTTNDPSIFYHRNGNGKIKIKSNLTMIDGKICGQHLIYDESKEQTPLQEINFDNGFRHGTHIIFFSSRLIKEVNVGGTTVVGEKDLHKYVGDSYCGRMCSIKYNYNKGIRDEKCMVTIFSHKNMKEPNKIFTVRIVEQKVKEIIEKLKLKNMYLIKCNFKDGKLFGPYECDKISWFGKRKIVFQCNVIENENDKHIFSSKNNYEFRYQQWSVVFEQQKNQHSV